MNLDSKLLALDEIYRAFDRFTSLLTVSCAPHCSDCCTQNVTLTTLEGLFILYHATPEGKKCILDKATAESVGKRFCPEISLNDLAELYAREKEIPEEAGHSPNGRCPLLERDLCSIYPVRPIGCRCLVSKRICRETGFADMEPFWLTVNTLFLQFIEHIDAGGLFGNLADVLLFLKSNENVEAYKTTGILDQKARLIQNRQISALLIPPEHKNSAADILSELQRVSNQYQ